MGSEELIRQMMEEYRVGTKAGHGQTSVPATATTVDMSGPSSTTTTPMVTIPAEDFREMVDCMKGLMEGMNRLNKEMKDLRTVFERPLEFSPMAPLAPTPASSPSFVPWVGPPPVATWDSTLGPQNE